MISSEIDWLHVVTLGIGASSGLALRSLWRAITADVAKRITSTLSGIRIFDKCTCRFLRHPLWSGEWSVTWKVNSPTFEPANTECGRLYRCFNSIAFEGSGSTTTGHRIPYGFVGKLSRDKTIVTGIWFDRRGGDGGYHGVFQLRASGNGHAATGLWAGFSETSAEIKADKFEWTRVSD